jgi:hypothetical protein
MQYIGIVGHRGSGKTSTAYLLGNMLELIKMGYSKDNLKLYYKEWCETINNDQNAIYDCALNYIYFDEFGEMPKSFVAQLLSIDMSVLDSDIMKDTMYVNLLDFRLYSLEDNFTIVDSDWLLKNRAVKYTGKEPVYMQLREFVKCFSIDIMQKYFGSNVWLKVLRVNDSKWNEPEGGWRIFSDIKTIDEIDYIKEKNGVLICTRRPSKRKSKKGITNIEECNPDYVIDTTGELVDLFGSIYEIAEKIYKNLKNN